LGIGIGDLRQNLPFAPSSNTIYLRLFIVPKLIMGFIIIIICFFFFLNKSWFDRDTVFVASSNTFTLTSVEAFSDGDSNRYNHSMVEHHRYHRDLRRRLRERRVEKSAEERGRDGRESTSSTSASKSLPSSSSSSDDDDDDDDVVHDEDNVGLGVDVFEREKNRDDDNSSVIDDDTDQDNNNNEAVQTESIEETISTSTSTSEMLTSEQMKMVELFDEIEERRRFEILAAMTDFAKTEAKEKGEELNVDKDFGIDRIKKKIESIKNNAQDEIEREKNRDPRAFALKEQQIFIEKVRRDDPTNKNVQKPLRDENERINVDYGTYDTCDTCEVCHLGDAPNDGVEVNKHQEIRGDPGVSNKDNEDKANEKKPVHCKECFGCNVQLERIIKRTKFKGKSVQVFSGASGAAVLKGKIFKKDSAHFSSESGNSVGVNQHLEEIGDETMPVFVKAWCNFGGWAQTPENFKSGVPDQCGEDKFKKNKRKCHEAGGRYGFGECNFKFISALDKMANAANLSSVVPRSWTMEVKSFLPFDGYSTSGHKLSPGTKAQFYEKAPGVSIEAVLGVLDPTVNFASFKKISHDNVMRAAMFDLLFTESDRHGQNIFFSDEGEITLIDSEGAFGGGFQSANSMLLPGHQKFEINRVGFGAIAGCGNNCPGPAKPYVSPMATLDYRCHVKKQFVGFDFPSGVLQFLKKIKEMSTDAVFEEFELTHEKHASHLKKTVDELLQFGFEGALLLALRRQEGGNGLKVGKYGLKYWYPITKACCGVETCKIHAVRMQQISDDSVTIRMDDAGSEALTLWGANYEDYPAHSNPDDHFLSLKRDILKLSSERDDVRR